MQPPAPAHSQHHNATNPRSMPEDNGGPGARGFGGATGGDGDDAEAPLLDGSEQWEWEAVANLDTFFTRIYRCGCRGRAKREQEQGGGDAPPVPCSRWLAALQPAAGGPETRLNPRRPCALRSVLLQVLGRKGFRRHAHRPHPQPPGPRLHRCASPPPSLLLRLEVGWLPQLSAGAARAARHTLCTHPGPLFRSRYVGDAAALRKLGGAAGRVPAEGYVRHLGGE